MKYLTIIFLFITVFAHAQKSDSTKIEQDTLYIDLLKYDAYSRILLIDQQRSSIFAQQESLKAKMEILNEKYAAILDAEVRHDEASKNRSIINYELVGTKLRLFVKKQSSKKSNKN